MSVRARVLASRIMLRMEKKPETAESLGVKVILREVPQKHGKEISTLLEGPTQR